MAWRYGKTGLAAGPALFPLRRQIFSLEGCWYAQRRHQARPE